MKILILSLILVSCSKESKIYLAKQWHLSAETKTSNIEQGKTLPHFKNQLDLYLWSKKMIEDGKSKAIIAEGCEGEITNSFKTAYNSWTLEKLQKRVKDQDYQNILAPVPMKLKALFPDLDVFCGDDLKLINQNLKASSDMRGFFGFYQRLFQARESSESEKFQAYAKTMQSLFKRQTIVDPLDFARQGILDAVNNFEELVKKRNEKFAETINKHKDSSPIVIIGGLHIRDLKEKLEKRNIKVEVYTPKGYKDDEMALLNKVKEEFQRNSYSNVKFFLFPENFNLKKFDFGDMIRAKEMMSDSELKELEKLVTKHGLPSEVLFSDFDGDGIRDFTISTSGTRMIIAPEDYDWDNDGVLNLIDDTLGKTPIASTQGDTPLANNYLSQTKISNVIPDLKKHVKLVQDNGQYHEFLVLEVFYQLLKKVDLPIKKVKFLRASNLDLSYGQNSFFNYVQGEQVLNYDPKKLNRFITREYEKSFKGAPFKQYINSYIIPLIIHSLGHEVAHSLPNDIEDFAREAGWKWEDTTIQSLYLNKSRETAKKRNSVKKNLTYQNKTHKQWVDLFKTNTKTDTTFLQKHNLLSVYATQKPSEWFAEYYSLCLFRKIYPKSKNQAEAIKWEKLLGINPSAIDSKFCLNF